MSQATFARPLADFLRSHRDAYVGFATRAVVDNPMQGPGSFSEAELGQMVDGFLAVVLEDLEARGSETRTFYLETVIPGLVGSGTRFDAVVHTVAGWTVHVVDDFARSYAGPDVAGAEDWMARFFAGYLADIARVGAQAGATGP